MLCTPSLSVDIRPIEMEALTYFVPLAFWGEKSDIT